MNSPNPAPPVRTANDYVEVAFTQNAGWCWRCHPCDTNRYNLAEADARSEASDHEASAAHQARIAEAGS